ncbi:MAG: hypothetical protein HW421_3860 [Ignavibacteria bacterium]|nr:hypothetical protein [Ignavibacteria bacterium]
MSEELNLASIENTDNILNQVPLLPKGEGILNS